MFLVVLRHLLWTTSNMFFGFFWLLLAPVVTVTWICHIIIVLGGLVRLSIHGIHE